MKLKQFWNQFDKWNNLAACILVICDQGGYKNHPTSAGAGAAQVLHTLFVIKVVIRITLPAQAQELLKSYILQHLSQSIVNKKHNYVKYNKFNMYKTRARIKQILITEKPRTHE